MSNVGVVIGRFQTHELHEGHLELLDIVNKRHPNQMLILVGVGRTPPTQRQPLPFTLRAEMLRTIYPNAVILPLADCRSDEDWSKLIDRTIQIAFPFTGAVLYGGRDNSLSCYSGKHKTHEVVGTIDSESATERREQVARSMLHTPDFRAGIIYAIHNQPPRTYNTVDVGLMRRDGMTVCLIRKAEDGRRWRLPGGVVDDTDPTFEHAAAREAFEETGLAPGIGSLQYVGNRTVADWRDAGDADTRYHTMLFTAFVTGTAGARAGDDADELCFMELHALEEHDIVPEHWPLIQLLQEYH